MAVRVKLERNKMSRRHTLVWSDDPPIREPIRLERNRGRDTRESPLGTRSLEMLVQEEDWLKRRIGEHPDIRGMWSRSLVAGRSQVTCYFPVRGSSFCFLCAQTQ
jgi:hypothetical protein